jgi:hypothetical protein
MKYLSVILFFALALTLTVKAQKGQGGVAKVTTELFAASSTAIVKGAPFSAEAISESVQTLSDGNKITRGNTTRMFRDSEGRYRRESDSSTASGFSFAYSDAASAFAFQDAISIFDPVSNVRYSLNPSNKTARRMNSLPRISEGTLVLNGQTMTLNGQTLSPALKAQIETNAPKKTQAAAPPLLATTPFGENGFATTLMTGTARAFNAGKTESLGTREFEGVTAEGTRTVTTIPAGAIGNERPIETVYERWYSKELQLIVYSLRSDPRFGEQTYRLTNINRSEPDRSLFVPPADYKIVTDSAFIFTTRPREDK